MAIAVFSDIHGNLEALEAILNDIRKNRKIKDVYYLGDAITFGPDSSKCLKLLHKAGVKCVVGNHEQRIIRYDKSVSAMTHAGIKHMEYIYHSLDNEDIRFIKSMATERFLDFKGYRLCFTHYAHDNKGIVLEDFDDFSESGLEKMFASSDCDVVFFGHMHTHKLIINPAARSYYCLGTSGGVKGDKTFYTYFDIRAGQDNNYNFDSYRVVVRFNRKKFVQKMTELDMPEKANFSTRYFGIDFDPPPVKKVEEEDND
ncbi:MAG: metallophosphoesterase [Christensenellaceae bacterium]|jgi:predicted phosphodiesterase|nr:metallophosphoesterase [Christensenellaceae bacterium]